MKTNAISYLAVITIAVCSVLNIFTINAASAQCQDSFIIREDDQTGSSTMCSTSPDLVHDEKILRMDAGILSEGVYFMQIKNKNGFDVKQFIKK